MAGTYHYANQQLYFTSLLYFVLLLMGVWGWWQWSRHSQGRTTNDKVVAAVGVQS